MLVKGVIDNQAAIDKVMEKFSDNWKLSRMACVDRNIIRIAVFEMLYCDDIPPRVTINEAVDIGKKYGTEDSGAFINGVLDSIYQQHTPLPSEKNAGIP
jgi:N utilization substance protein B